VTFSQHTSSPSCKWNQEGEVDFDHYAVLGNPIQHSKSPIIHRLFAQQTFQHMTYSAILVPEDDLLPEILSEFYHRGGKGVNITAPFKQNAYSLVDSVSERAKQAQAINTIRWNTHGQRHGDNTDGVGFIRDVVNNHGFSLHAKRILILGAGGAALGIIAPLLNQKPNEVIITNRTELNAKKHAKRFQPLGNIFAVPLSDITGSFDCIVNTTNSDSSFFAQLPAHVLHTNTFCYDLSYAPHDTPFLIWARKMGVSKLTDGLGMLIEQAAQSFYVWRGVIPDTSVLLANQRLLFHS
jgi:shikimate dehydrogenase